MVKSFQIEQPFMKAFKGQEHETIRSHVGVIDAFPVYITSQISGKNLTIQSFFCCCSLNTEIQCVLDPSMNQEIPLL